MFKKIKFYKMLLIEIVETLCSICLYLHIDGMYNHNRYAVHMKGHYEALKDFSEELRKRESGFNAKRNYRTSR